MNRTGVSFSLPFKDFEVSNVIDTLQMSGLNLFKKMERDPEIDTMRRPDVR